MKLLNEATATIMIRLDDIENKARDLAFELDSLDIRLHRAFTALCIDIYVGYLDAERKRMLKDEEQAETSASWVRLPALGVYGLYSLFSGQEPNWKGAVSSIFREKPYGDIRVAANNDDVKLINVSAIARWRSMSIAEAVTYLEQQGYKVFTWPEFEARAENLRMAALRGEAAHLGIEEVGLEYVRALTTDPEPVGIARASSSRTAFKCCFQTSAKPPAASFELTAIEPTHPGTSEQVHGGTLLTSLRFP